MANKYADNGKLPSSALLVGAGLVAAYMIKRYLPEKTKREYVDSMAKKSREVRRHLSAWLYPTGKPKSKTVQDEAT